MNNKESCPKCKSNMEEGVFTDGWWYSGTFPMRKNKSAIAKVFGLQSINNLSLWESLFTMFQRSKTKSGYDVNPLIGVTSYRCTLCGYIESYAK
ncbi:MAG: hypothetical protein NUV65_01125 [Candidatus Roizmanbacteria bacterium]|nr:hypothetical protein [Candidatus Roizmanbacteria bacterium]